MNKKLTFQLFLLIISFLLVSTIQAQTNRIVYKGKKTVLSKAVKEANRLLNDSTFYKNIRSVSSFDSTNYSVAQISREIQTFQGEIQIRSYWNPLGTANAKTLEKISVNTSKLNRYKDPLKNHKDVVNTLIHEYVHAVDYHLDGTFNYSHDFNSEGQENTAPWKIGSIAEDMARE